MNRPTGEDVDPRWCKAHHVYLCVLCHETTTELPRVTVELDGGPTEMAFGYVPKGKPTYGDVSPHLAPCISESAAEIEGAVMLAVGNWQSFTVEKRYYVVPEVPRG